MAGVRVSAEDGRARGLAPIATTMASLATGKQLVPSASSDSFVDD